MEQFSMFESEKKNKHTDMNDDLSNAKKRIKVLRKEILYHNELYYSNDAPKISDYEYDKLTQELKALEQQFPELITKNSPTQMVGGHTKNEFSKVNHLVQMQSLNDVFSFEKVKEFVVKLQKEYGEIEFVVETKIDGLSVSLEYEKGKLKRGSTRGDGTIGEDVTSNLLTIDNIPLNLNTQDTIEFRGEVYMSIAQFNAINDELISQKKEMMANPRNAAAGTLRQLDSDLVKKRKLSIFVFNIQKSEREFQLHSESLEYAKKCGVGVIEYSRVAKNVEQVLQYIKEIGEMRSTLPYEIDGAVIKVNDLQLRNTIGTTSKVPKWAVAYKYPPIEKLAKLEDVLLQVGRTGQVTPLAKIAKTLVSGSVISKCTLHNFEYIKEKDIRIGDYVWIRKAGDVIPEVVKVELEKRDKDILPYFEPIYCPVCNEKLEKDEKQVAIRCLNSECPAQSYRAIVHFASRDCMDIDGLGEKVVEQLISLNIITNIADIYGITFEQLMKVEGFKEKSAVNLLNAINDSKSQPLDRLIFGLGIRHIGKKAAKILASLVCDIYEFEKIPVENIESVKDIGSVMAISVKEFFIKEETHTIIKRLEQNGVNIKGNKKEYASNILEDMNICITGTMDKISRNELEEFIEMNNGNVANSVSKNTTLVIYGDNAGSKYTKAQEMNVPCMKYEEFIAKYFS